MDAEICWYCDQPVTKDEAVEMNIDGAVEQVHEACREAIEKSVAGPGQNQPGGGL